MLNSFDCIIIGGGPGGSTLGTILAQAGWKVAIVEKETFPRFRIGESLLPYSMPIFRKTGFIQRMETGKYIQKWGAQFVDYRYNKEIYFRFDGDKSDAAEPMAYEVPRAEFDTDMLDYAKEQGVTVFQPERVEDVSFIGDEVHVKTDRQTLVAPYIADASGRTAFLGNKMGLKKALPDINNVGVFAHYTGVKRKPGREAGDIIIAVLPDQSWSWTIPFQGETTSVGIVTGSKNIDKSVSLDRYIEEKLQINPIFQDRMADSKRVSEVMAISNYSHNCESIVGDRWIAIGDAGIFLDPVFSSGVHLTITCAMFAADILQRAAKSGEGLNSPIFEYEKLVRKGVKRFHWFIRLFYDSDFVTDMERAMALPHMKQAFTSIVAGNVWDDENPVFKMNGM